MKITEFDELEYSEEVEDDESDEVDLFLEKVVSEFEKQLDEHLCRRV